MKKLSVLLISLVVLFVLALSYFRGGDPRRVLEARDEPSSSPSADEPAELQADEQVESPKVERIALEDESVSNSEGMPSLDLAPEETAPIPILSGRVLLPGGSPAVGAEVGVHGWQANNDRVLEHGLPEQWENPSARVEVDGGFELHFDPPKAFQFTLDVQLEGYAVVSWRWHSLPAGRTTDVGEITLQRAGSITGHVLDASGEPLREGWSVHADAARPAGEGRDAARGRSSLDPTTGAFRIDGMPPGPTKLSAYSRVANWIHGPTVTVRAGETVEADIVYEGPDLSSRITVITFSRPFYVFRPEPEKIRLYRGSEFVGALEHLEGSSQSNVFEGLDPALSYRVEIEDERFLPWSQEGVKPGASIDARVWGSAGALLEVLDDTTDEPVPTYAVRVAFRDSTFWPNEFEVEPAGDPTGRVRQYRGWIPGTQSVLVIAEGYATKELLVEELLPNEIRPLTCRLERGASIRGRALHADGEPVRGGEVVLVPGSPRDDEWEDFWEGWDGGLSEVARRSPVEEDGGFDLGQVGSGEYTVAARAVGLELRRDLRIEGGEAPELLFEFPASGSLEGRLLVPHGVEAGGRAIRVCSTTELEATRNPTFSNQLLGAGVSTDAEGRFRVDRLLEGEVHVLLVLPEQEFPTGHGSSGMIPACWIELGVAEIEGGETVEAVFDAGDQFPGSLKGTIRVNGEPAVGAVLLVTREPRGIRRTGSVGESGEGGIGELFPGEYRIQVRMPGAHWIHECPELVRIKSGSTASFRAEITVVKGELDCVDAVTRKLLAGEQVGWKRADSKRRGSEGSAESDREGRLSLELLPGSYLFGRLDDWGRLGEELVRVEWGAGGPSDGRLILSPPEDE